MADEKSWRSINVNLGVLTACVAGILAVVSAYNGVQHWVDSRIDSALAPVETRLDSAVSECRRACYQRWNSTDDPTMAYQTVACGGSNELAGP
jgi:hypothetical protein